MKSVERNREREKFAHRTRDPAMKEEHREREEEKYKCKYHEHSKLDPSLKWGRTLLMPFLKIRGGRVLIGNDSSSYTRLAQITGGDCSYGTCCIFINT